MVFFLAATIFTMLKLCGDLDALRWWDLFINYGLCQPPRGKLLPTNMASSFLRHVFQLVQVLLQISHLLWLEIKLKIHMLSIYSFYVTPIFPKTKKQGPELSRIS